MNEHNSSDTPATNEFTEKDALNLAAQYSIEKLGWSFHTWNVGIPKIHKGEHVWEISFKNAFNTVVFSIDVRARRVTGHTTKLGL